MGVPYNAVRNRRLVTVLCTGIWSKHLGIPRNNSDIWRYFSSVHRVFETVLSVICWLWIVDLCKHNPVWAYLCQYDYSLIMHLCVYISHKISKYPKPEHIQWHFNSFWASYLYFIFEAHFEIGIKPHFYRYWYVMIYDTISIYYLFYYI